MYRKAAFLFDLQASPKHAYLSADFLYLFEKIHLVKFRFHSTCSFLFVSSFFIASQEKKGSFPVLIFRVSQEKTFAFGIFFSFHPVLTYYIETSIRKVNCKVQMFFSCTPLISKTIIRLEVFFAKKNKKT